MKNFNKIIFYIAAVFMAVAGCKKDEQRVVYQGGFPPAFSVSTDSVKMSFANAANPAVTLSWTNPEYRFNTGVNSLNVTYSIEIDTVGANFSSPKKYTTSIASDLSKTFTVSELNDIMLNQMVLAINVSHKLEARVTASISSLPGNITQLQSNKGSFTATPYAIPPKVAPPASGHLYIIGSATAGGWNNPVPVPAQEFIKISETNYEITLPLTGGQEYLLIPVNGDWTHKYAVADNTISGLADGGDFGLDLAKNFPGPGVSGNYKIVADFQRGKFTVTKL